MISRVRVVVLGTGTSVGKTHVATALAGALTAQGRSVLGLKPIESGLGPDSSAESDGARLGARSAFSVAPLYALPAPVSPHLAARLVDREIRIPDVVEWIRALEQQAEDALPRDSGRPSPVSVAEPVPVLDPVTVVETAGGVFSPLTPETTNLDLALVLGVPFPGVGATSTHFTSAADASRWVLVAPDRLGVLHDLGAVLRALPRMPEVIALSATEGEADCEMNNVREVEQVVVPQVLALRSREGRGRGADVIPRVFGVGHGAEDVSAILGALRLVPVAVG